jgi:hypothetical protein
MSRDAEVREVAQRRYWRAAEGRIVVEAWRGSGERLASFARRHGLSRKRVAWWASRLEGRRPAAVRFHPVRLVGGGSIDGAALELEVEHGWRLRLPRGFEAEELRRVLAVLEERSGC